ncbi:S41 family peptidase [Desulfosporosinus sp. SYSU MS00001]|uniref:S41 family peptidase n=1 Tax=Desulfosporosinus sp. SYSU MS00001 TaxID=3416284 RepID=UPI003CF6D00A
MKQRLFNKRAVRRLFVNILLSLILILGTSTPVWADTNNGVLAEVRSLLQTQYADPVSQDVLNAPTIDEMLKRLGDPHTTYFSPEEYQNFISNINLSFIGIGVYIEMLPEGVKIDSVIEGSPAEDVGLKSGDLITSVDGHSLTGLTSDEASNLLRGPEGSTVQITVKQGSGIKDFSVTRKAIVEPTVTGSVLNNHIGYLDIKSFGEQTPLEFAMTAVNLHNQNVDSWIVDLRENGGGYLSSGINLAGFFIGPQVTVQVKDRKGVLHLYQAPKQPFVLNQPIIFLTNENSASASELLTGAVKDYHKATIVGKTTYGKGTVQSMFNLSNGGVLKMTVDHFYSAFGHEINKVGIKPDVEIDHADSLKAAELMLSDKTEAHIMARSPEYWQAWGELSNLETDDDRTQSYQWYYPEYEKISELKAIPLNQTLTVHFNEAVNWQSVNDSSIELINSLTGDRTLTTFETLGPSDVQVIPDKALLPDSTYWLVVHPTVLNTAGQAAGKGTLTIVHTVKGGEKEKVQSIVKSKVVSERNLINRSDSDYGWAIMNN